jgi:hypothetical protein
MGSITRIYRELKALKSQRINNSIDKHANEPSRQLLQEVPMASKYIPAYKGDANQNNTEISPHSNQNGHGQEYKQQMLARMEGKRNLIYCHFWWEYKLVQPLWKAVWRFLTKLKLELSYNPLIPFLGIYLKEGKSGYNEDTCTPMFISAMFTIAKIWKQPRCPTTDEWIKKMWYIYMMKNTKDEIMSFADK